MFISHYFTIRYYLYRTYNVYAQIYFTRSHYDF
nr:MAG TPA: hypothetical protein [Caudoviricetes sp.]